MEFYCRLCGELKEPIDLLYSLNDISSKLFKCCDWQWQESAIEARLPQNVCETCYDRLDQSWQFSQNIRKAQNVLLKTIVQPCSVFVLEIGTNTIEDEPKSSTVDLIKLELIPEDSKYEATGQSMENDSTSNDDNINILSNEHADFDISNSQPESEYSEDGDCPLDTEWSGDEDNISDADDDCNSNSNEKSSTPKVLNRDDYLALIPSESRLKNGQVDLEKVTELQLRDWSIFKYKCWVCAALLDDEDAMLQHLKKTHPNEPIRWQCSLCPKLITKFSKYLRRHVTMIHYPYLTFCCSQCNIFFWDKNKQNKHLNRIDHLRVLKKCDVCGRMLGDSKSLRRHIVAKHTSANKSECYLCKKQFAMDYLRRHMINVHCTVRPKLDKTFMCESCGKAFSTKGLLVAHSVTHNKSDEVMAFPCDICDQKFKNKVRLKFHKEIHNKEKNFQCDVCGFKTHSARWLRKHKIIHMEKRHECGMCGKKFTLARQLRVHHRSHTGERPFECTLCDYRTVSSTNLRKHTIVVHKIPYFNAKTNAKANE